MWTTRGAAWDGLGGGRAEPDIIRGCREDSGEGPHLVKRSPDGDCGNILMGRAEA